MPNERLQLTKQSWPIDWTLYIVYSWSGVRFCQPGSAASWHRAGSAIYWSIPEKMKETCDSDTTVQFTLEGFILSTESSELMGLLWALQCGWQSWKLTLSVNILDQSLTVAIISHTWLLFSLKVFDDRVLTPEYEDNVFDISVNT